MKALVEQTRENLTALRNQRDASLKKNEQVFKKRVEQQREQQEKEKRASVESSARQEKQIEERYAQDKQAVEKAHQRQQEDERQWRGQQWAVLLRDWRTEDRPAVCFVIGGADGLAPTLRERATIKLAFGASTWPHQLVRIMLLEQLYRVGTMLAGHPYHRA